MEIVALALAALFAVSCVAFVARPFLSEPEAADDRLAALTPADQERLRLVEQRDRALAALKELEFDHRTGKIADADYEQLVGPLRREAAEAMRALDPPRAAPQSAERVDAPA
jgi:hypothetical protein